MYDELKCNFKLYYDESSLTMGMSGYDIQAG